MWCSIVLVFGVAHARFFAVPGHGPLSQWQQRQQITDATAYATPHSGLSSRKARATLRMDMGFAVDPAATASSISIMALFGAFLVKLSGLNRSRERRNSAAGNLREAKIALLAGNLDLESYERAATAAAASAQEYEAAKTIISVNGADVLVGNRIDQMYPRTMNQTTTVIESSRVPKRNEVPQMTQAALDRRGYFRRAEHNQLRGNQGAIDQPGSEAENPSSAVGDVMFGCVLASLLGLFAFSLTPDPLAQGSRAAFDSNCDSCVELQIQPKAQSDVESMARVEQFLKYTSEPAERFYRITEQEMTGNEVFNGHTVDVQSMLLSK